MLYVNLFPIVTAWISKPRSQRVLLPAGRRSVSKKSHTPTSCVDNASSSSDEGEEEDVQTIAKKVF